MIKPLFILLVLLFGLNSCFDEKHYNESADAKADILLALSQAKMENLPVVIIFGANWCPECRALCEEIKTGKNASKFAKEFKIVKVDVGDFDHNLDIANAYGNPIDGGIPGATILSPDHKMIYVTQRGELSTARAIEPNGIYDFLKKVSRSNTTS